MENINTNVSEEIKEDVKVDTVEVKTFTQEEVNEMISKRLQRERKDSAFPLSLPPLINLTFYVFVTAEMRQPQPCYKQSP